MPTTDLIRNLMESDIELKSSILNLDIANDFDFFKKDLVLGNIDYQEKRFLDLVFDIISDLKHFSNIIIERQYKVMHSLYLTEDSYKKRVDGEVEKYNKEAETLIEELKKKFEAEELEEEKNMIKARIKNIRLMSPTDYILAAAKHEGAISFFKGSSEKFIIMIYSKLAISRSKSGYQQEMMFTKRLEQKYREISSKSGGLFNLGRKKEEK